MHRLIGVLMVPPFPMPSCGSTTPPVAATWCAVNVISVPGVELFTCRQLPPVPLMLMAFPPGKTNCGWASARKGTANSSAAPKNNVIDLSEVLAASMIVLGQTDNTVSTVETRYPHPFDEIITEKGRG